ncbi:MAG TPA: zf-HC2 domain-containing protein [Gemmatimonadales bacterium]|jgi:anti-sigma factor (TIGR02949 family)|nr:zf-HC2 domain-containing protein [Gemmatimonadales bacterium]
MSERMNCREAIELLQDYLKQELTPESADLITAHLQRCRHCFDHAEYERKFLLMLERKAGGQCCPERLRLKILARLRTPDPS